MKRIRCCRCGCPNFGLFGPDDIFEDYDSRLVILCRGCLGQSEGTLIEVGALEFLKEDIDE